MEHSNPLLCGQESRRFITFGEVMLPLTPPNYGKIRVTNSFEASYGGSEANIALALANLGVDSTFFSVVPNNKILFSGVRVGFYMEPHRLTSSLHLPCRGPSTMERGRFLLPV